MSGIAAQAAESRRIDSMPDHAYGMLAGDVSCPCCHGAFPHAVSALVDGGLPPAGGLREPAWKIVRRRTRLVDRRSVERRRGACAGIGRYALSLWRTHARGRFRLQRTHRLRLSKERGAVDAADRGADGRLRPPGSHVRVAL